MSRLSPVELLFFATESPTRPMHAGAIMVFDPPAHDGGADIVDRTVAAFRATPPAGPPWNVRPVLGLSSHPHWETVPEVDMEHHVRRLALPRPGSMEQLTELVSLVYPPLLDRNRPLWEVYIIEGLEGGRMAVFFKGHHSLGDGVSGLRMIYESLSASPNDDPRPLWSVVPERRPDTPSARERGGFAAVGSVVRRVTGLLAAVPEIAQMAPQGIGLARSSARPFSGARAPALANHMSPARSFAVLELPLGDVKRLGEEFDATVNDVILSVCDDAMQRYVRENGGGAGRMVSTVAVSVRGDGDKSASNAVTGVLVTLGAPDAKPAERIAEVVDATKRVKSAIRQTSSLPLQLQNLFLVAGLELREQLPVGRATVPPLSNFIVSNIPGGPAGTLYLGRARLAGFYVNPIITAGQAANFTVISMGDSLFMGIGAARNIIPDTPRLAQLVEESFRELQASAGPAKQPRARRGSPRPGSRA